MLLREETRRKLTRFVHHPATDVAVMLMIVASIVTLVVELAIAEGTTAHTVLSWVNGGFIGIFVVELVIRYLAETKKKRFFRNYWIDILAVLPFLRLLRVLRVFRLLSVFRFGLALSRRMGWINASLQREAVQWFAVAVFIFVVILFGAIGLRLAEPDAGHTMGETLWWATMSLIAGEPIGEVPTSSLGRVIAVGVMVAGLTVFAMLTGVVSAMMVHRLGNIDTRLMDIDEIRDHIIICGWNRAGFDVLAELQNDPDYQRHNVVIVGEFEETPEWPDSIRYPDQIYIVRGDFTRLDMLQRAGLARASHAIVLADRLVERSDQDRDARAVLTAMLIERVKRSIFTSVELLNRDNESLLREVGVDEIVVGTEYAASILASTTKNRGIVKVFDELLTSKYGNQLYKVPTPDEYVGKSYGEVVASAKTDHDTLVIGIDRPDAEQSQESTMLVNPDADHIVGEGTLLITIARKRPRWRKRKR